MVLNIEKKGGSSSSLLLQLYFMRLEMEVKPGSMEVVCVIDNISGFFTVYEVFVRSFVLRKSNLLTLVAIEVPNCLFVFDNFYCIHSLRLSLGI